MTRRRSTVLFVSLSGWLGGPGRSIATVLAHLPEELQAVLACPQAGDLLPEARERSNLREYVPLVRRRGPIPDPLGRARSTFRLLVWLIQNRRRVVAIHANGYSELNIVAPAAIISRTPVVAWLHGSEVGRWDKRLGALWRLGLRPRVVAVSPTASRTAIGSRLVSSNTIRIVPNPIDPADCLARARSERRTNGVVVGYFAAAKTVKGFDLLPHIITRLADAPINWAVFASRPDKGTSLHEPVWSWLESFGPRIMLYGRQTRVADAYGTCDIVLCPSLTESFGRIAAEAMLNGLPVVASDIEPHRALLAGPDPAGLLFPVEDLDIAAHHIRQLAGDPTLRMALGKAGQSRAAAFAPDRIVAKLVDLYLQPHVSRDPR